jgi:hypothetical protein
MSFKHCFNLSFLLGFNQTKYFLNTAKSTKWIGQRPKISLSMVWSFKLHLFQSATGLAGTSETCVKDYGEAS